ncbi:SDR family NAD(P)-dependent oxidoreductase [Legionella sp. MW5194]|uniref:SDR family NAD(P)-dependent oxidoreductase n=1 Tax=Legionella sp. MW5194 TaxID=2662448 RepID=UPI00193E9A9C|nr:SDR family NAD(P)-dependent oxidoreductase [Legionella sp. MW5194]QRN03264.1 SDR family NAD(P)-dependent oxidoreductase [Legionella sp. MW5194]
MTKSTWMILGATSIIANEFAQLAAAAGHPLLLVGRDTLQLDVIADEITLRHRVACDILTADFSEDIRELLKKIQTMDQELSLFIAHSAIVENNHLNSAAIGKLVKTNVLSTVQVIHTYLNKQQHEHQLLFLSSVAACRGRARNSLYGGSKAAIEVYLQGLQQQAGPSTTITVARLGFIDTVQTYGMPGVFYASPPKACAKACWANLHRKKRRFYHPGFWRLIMMVIKHLPFFIYRRMGNV